MKKKTTVSLGVCILIIGVLSVTATDASPIEHKFKSPSFSGIGQSSHYLTIENQETSRKDAIKQELEDLQEQLERDAENTTLAKFIRNVESRIYSTLSRQIVDSMFGENPSDSGSFDIEGTGISYENVDDSVILTVTDEYGNVTVITIPLGDFGI
jgi:curli production assembly/transport component CsgF